MLDFLVVTSTFGVAGMLAALIVAAVRGAKKRWFAVGLLLFVMLFAVSVALYPREENEEPAENGPPQIENGANAEYVD